MFQSTHPGRGATKKGEAGAVIEGVSIHAPRAECDFTATFLQCCTSCFNPRTSGGVRHLSPAGKVGRVLFQSTHPGRGATHVCVIIRLASLFQSTHPGRGATQQSRIIQAYGMFQSTHPGRGATWPSVHVRTITGFNPRTPGGVRPWLMNIWCVILCFNPRTPGGVRRSGTFVDFDLSDVSIHAPRAGCDTICRSAIRNYSRFQSTHPGRGATTK